MQATVERIKSDFPLTEEIIEWYDGALNVGVARSTVAGVTVETYSYFAVNEILLVKGNIKLKSIWKKILFYFSIFFNLEKECKALKINETDEAPFEFVVINGTEHILSPLSVLFLNPNFKVIFKPGFFAFKNKLRFNCTIKVRLFGCQRCC